MSEAPRILSRPAAPGLGIDASTIDATVEDSAIVIVHVLVHLIWFVCDAYWLNETLPLQSDFEMKTGMGLTEVARGQGTRITDLGAH